MQEWVRRWWRWGTVSHAAVMAWAVMHEWVGKWWWGTVAAVMAWAVMREWVGKWWWGTVAAVMAWAVMQEWVGKWWWGTVAAVMAWAVMWEWVGRWWWWGIVEVIDGDVHCWWCRHAPSTWNGGGSTEMVHGFWGLMAGCRPRGADGGTSLECIRCPVSVDCGMSFSYWEGGWLPQWNLTPQETELGFLYT